ncbi:hypothetical protein Poli38472_004034 [Pythium oligandrum]|uniref:Uracil-DNA glycosylase-like domain-containing protein n=1 Tax=Pythium oligandrum TaxID=41045 RepID=A0A8K1FMG9_PYTOL|nr:hypothetical protein Poli38472_004034 [Pythium oligandrum]|eukprot:TMW66269.1 hypothetical protein Poli38472_004034 [Pythium oligandrum]
MFDRFRFQAKRTRDGDDEEQEEKDESISVASARVLSPVGNDGKRQRTGQPEPENEPMASKAKCRWQERWHGICTPCFEKHVECVHFPEKRLRLLLVGHNPSDHAWESGYSYSNPTNHFWNLLRGRFPPLSWSGVIPFDAHITEQNNMPHMHGIGMTSIGLEPGNDANSYNKQTMMKWKQDFFERLRRHCKRVCATEHDADETCSLPHGPMIIAFSGKRQFSWLFTPPLTKVDHGKQARLPHDWPRECLVDCEVWVMPSTSGRAAMTKQQRAQPYRELAGRFHLISWPRDETNEVSVVSINEEVTTLVE